MIPSPTSSDLGPRDFEDSGISLSLPATWPDVSFICAVTSPDLKLVSDVNEPAMGIILWESSVLLGTVTADNVDAEESVLLESPVSRWDEDAFGEYVDDDGWSLK